MTPDALRTILDRLGYAPSQAAEAVGCDRSTVTRMLAGSLSIPEPVANALRYHALLVQHRIVRPVPAPKRGRPPKVA